MGLENIFANIVDGIGDKLGDDPDNPTPARRLTPSMTKEEPVVETAQPEQPPPPDWHTTEPPAENMIPKPISVQPKKTEPPKVEDAPPAPVVEYPMSVLRMAPPFGFIDSLKERLLNKKKYAQNKIYLILEDDNTAHTYMIRHTIKVGKEKKPVDFYWLANNGFNYEATSLLAVMKASKEVFKGNESCNFFFLERENSRVPGKLIVCKTKFSERASAEIQNAERSKLKDRVAERTFFGISKRWRPQALGDDLMKILVVGIVVMLLVWVVMTNLPGVLGTISANVDAHSLNATLNATATGFANSTHVTAT